MRPNPYDEASFGLVGYFPRFQGFWALFENLLGSNIPAQAEIPKQFFSGQKQTPEANFTIGKQNILVLLHFYIL